VRGLYPIVDLDSLESIHDRPQRVLDFAERVLTARPPLLQLRAKHSGARETLELLRALRPLCTRAGTRLIANDRPDLALLAECDGVHLGQDDLPLGLARRIAPGLLVGVSTHTPAQLAAALAEKPDYVAYGPVFGTASKERPDPVVGVAGLARAYAAARVAGIPLVAIGGINLARAAQISGDCDLAACIAALLPNPATLDGVSEAACALHATLGGSALEPGTV